MTTATVTWPAPADLAELNRDLLSVFERMSDLSWRATKLLEALDQPDGMWKEAVPSLDEFAALSRFIAVFETDLEEIARWLEQLRGARDKAAYSLDVAGYGDAC